MQMNYGYAGFNLHCFSMIQYLHTDYKFISIFHPFPITKITCMHALLKRSLGVTCSLQHTAASLTIYQVVKQQQLDMSSPYMYVDTCILNIV